MGSQEVSDVDWQGKHVTVAGLGVSGIPAARALHERGALVTVVNDGDDERSRAQAAELEALGVTVRLGDGDTLPESTELVVTAPGWKPGKPLFPAAAEAGVPVWGDVELAWRLQGPADAAPWLAVTGTNGKTTTVRMLASILEAAGLRTAAVGNIGVSLLDAVLGDETYDVLAVELSSYQLHWAPSLRAHSGGRAQPGPRPPRLARLHGRLRRRQGPDLRGQQRRLRLQRAGRGDGGPRARGRRRGGLPGHRLHPRHPGPLPARGGRRHPRRPGLRRQPAEAGPGARRGRATSTRRPRTTSPTPSPRRPWPAPSAYAPAAVRDGLRAFRPDAHRIEHVADVAGVTYIDDSKATNTHAAEASLAAYDPIVWIAGGLAKGATFDELVTGAAKRLRGVVLMGADRALIREALARHAPEVPVVDLDRTDTGAMSAAVREAARLAGPGDTVLLAPACASMDMFVNYNKRGEAFADAVRELADESA